MLRVCKYCELGQEIKSGKVCNKCKYNNRKEFFKEYYSKNKTGKTRIKRTDEEISLKRKEYYKDNKERCIKQSMDWQLKNKVLYSEYSKEYYKQYSKENNESIKERKRNWIKNKRHTNVVFKLHSILSGYILSSLKSKGYKKKDKTIDIIGCSIEELKIYLESKFEPWMTWENHGKYNGELNYGWDIDHISPVSKAQIENDLIKLYYYTNLSPLDSYINRCVKRDK